jgi:hypothetical protein
VTWQAGNAGCVPPAALRFDTTVLAQILDRLIWIRLNIAKSKLMR